MPTARHRQPPSHNRAAILGVTALLVFVGTTAAIALAKKPQPAPPPAAATGQVQVAEATTPAPQVPFGEPKKLSIPAIGVDAPVQNVGIDQHGNMAVPDSLAQVGWYQPGVRPGAPGSAVIAGHRGVQKGREGVFNMLGRLKVGDTIIVTDAAGATLTFTVKTSKTYKATDQPAEVFAATDTPLLNLITCTGAWEQTQQSYSDRLVVFTEMQRTK